MVKQKVAKVKKVVTSVGVVMAVKLVLEEVVKEVVQVIVVGVVKTVEGLMAEMVLILQEVKMLIFFGVMTEDYVVEIVLIVLKVAVVAQANQ